MPDLNGLAGDLHLTAGGVHQWLDVLGVTVNPSAAERLLAVTSDGHIVAARDGNGRQVRLDADLDARLLTSGAGIVLIHNHPSSTGLSPDDLAQLEKPGVAAIVAVGHDGSVYMAAAGRRYDRDLFEAVQYASARAEVDRRVREAVARETIAPANVDPHLAHVVAQALSKAGAIEYVALLAPGRRASYNSARAVFGPIVAAAARAVTRTRKSPEDAREHRSDDGVLAAWSILSTESACLQDSIS